MSDTKNICLIIFLLALTSKISFSQNVFSGKVIDAKEKQAVSYVNIGIIGKNVGTVSDEEGNFKIELSSEYDNDSIRFSEIGYQTQTYKIIEFKKRFADKSKIVLDESSYQLNEVVISGRQMESGVLGNQIESMNNCLEFVFFEGLLGTEQGMKVSIKNSPTYLEDFNCFIVHNLYDTLFMRLNIYSIKDGMPDKNLLKDNIYLVTTVKSGKVTIDLKQYNIIVENDFIVTLEWVRNYKSIKHGLCFSCKTSASGPYSRRVSQGDWRKLERHGFGFYFNAKY